MYISIDVGGTKSALASSLDLDKVNIIARTRFNNTNNFENDYLSLKKAITKLKGNTELDAIGIGLPGILKDDKTGIKTSFNLPNWEGHNIKKLLEDDFKTKVYVHHDVEVAALGEYLYGNGGQKDFDFLIWGTGLAGTKIFNVADKIRYVTNESGVQIISNESEFKTWSQNCCGADIPKKYNKKAEELNEEEWSEVLENFTIGLLNMIVVTSCKKIVIGGGIMEKQADKLSVIKNKVVERLTKEDLPDMLPEIVVAKLGSDAGILGGFALIKLEGKLISA